MEKTGDNFSHIQRSCTWWVPACVGDSADLLSRAVSSSPPPLSPGCNTVTLDTATQQLPWVSRGRNTRQHVFPSTRGEERDSFLSCRIYLGAHFLLLTQQFSEYPGPDWTFNIWTFKSWNMDKICQLLLSRSGQWVDPFHINSEEVLGQK